MKNILLGALTLCLTLSIKAQESPKLREVGLTFSNLNNFGITYRTGTAAALWRYNVGSLNNSSSSQFRDSIEYSIRRIGLNVSIGREFRNSVTEKLTFRYGLNLFTSFSTNTNEVDDQRQRGNSSKNSQIQLEPGVSAIVGLNYQLTDNLVLGAEMLPSVSYTYNIFDIDSSLGGISSNNSSDVNFDISNQGVLLSLMYQF